MLRKALTLSHVVLNNCLNYILTFLNLINYFNLGKLGYVAVVGVGFAVAHMFDCYYAEVDKQSKQLQEQTRQQAISNMNKIDQLMNEVNVMKEMLDNHSCSKKGEKNK